MARTSPCKKILASRHPATTQLKKTERPAHCHKQTNKTKKVTPFSSKDLSKPSFNQDIRIFQIYYEDWQKQLLDPVFHSFNNTQIKTELMEFEIFERLYSSAEVNGAKLWGALSWRYKEKTGISGAQLIKIIQANPGADVYYCNPHIINEALFHNAWLQGEISHPHLLQLSTALFEVLGWNPQELYTITPSNHWSMANYFIGSPTFWEKYLAFIREILAIAEKRLDSLMLNLLHAKTADVRGIHGGATYIPFIIERLFHIFIKTSGKHLKTFKIALPERERELNIHLKMLRDMKDTAHQTTSQWLAACWVNYRNLYLTQFYGKAWCQRYLRTITPTDIRFD